MIKIEAKKDGKGNIVISEDSFEMLLNCLDNQKFVGESPTNGDSISSENYNKIQGEIQDAIDQYNRGCRKVLHQNYVLDVTHNGLSLFKKYEHQDEITPWSGEDVGLVYSLFLDTVREYKKPENLKPLSEEDYENVKEGTTPIGKTEDGWMVCEPEPQPWLIERPLMYDGEYLTISEDGRKNRPWKEEEIKKIQELFNR